MKNPILIFVAALLLTSFAQASSPMTYQCQGVDSDLTFTLHPLSKRAVREGDRPVPYQLTLTKKNDESILRQSRVMVSVEDVYFSFQSTDRRIKGLIYLDEMNQTWLSVDGHKLKERFDCEAI